jgi:hypothetical protein
VFGSVELVVGSVAAVGSVLAMIGWKLQLGRFRTLAGAVFGGLLGGLVVGDFTVPDAGNWWADHPSAAATATGVLLLALTVLIVEAVVERVLRAAEDRRWQGAARLAVEGLLGEYAPVLTATERLHGVYGKALEAVHASAEIRDLVLTWQLQVPSDVADIRDDKWAHDGHAAVARWADVLAAWEVVCELMRTFEGEAVRLLGATAIEHASWDESWRERGRVYAQFAVRRGNRT